MKCPYQIKVIHKPEDIDGYVKNFAEDITEFCECAKSECPFYVSMNHHKLERCRRAENEVKD